MRIGVPKEVKNHEYRVAITPIGVHELTRHGHEVYVEKGAGVGSSIPDEEYVAAGATMLRRRRRRVGHRRHGAQGQGAGRRGVRPDARGPDPLHLPAPRRRPAADRGAGQPQGHRDRLRDRAAALGLAAAALPDVRGRRLPGPAGRRALADEGPGRPRRAARRRRRRRERQGRRDRRRRLRAERRQHRARHGRRRHPARHRPGQAADVVLALQQPGARPGVVAAGHRAAGASRPTWSSARC